MGFDEVHKKLGFGCMRLPMSGDNVDYAEFSKMIDAFLSAGFNYFDTAHGYIGGKSETAIRDCLAARYEREAFVLADKLTDPYFDKEDDIIPLFESQLKLCGVQYFDFYLFHCLNRTNYQKHKRCKTFETVRRLKEEGKIRHIAMSFHDTADVLDMILTEQPFIEAVQLQINYLDYDDPGVQSKACCDVAVKHGKQVIVMEPVKGGALAKLPGEAAEMLNRFGKGSPASLALRYAAGFPGVFMVLSGMGNMEMMTDNIRTFNDFVPLSDAELDAADKIRGIIRKLNRISCTGCDYCAEGCPAKIPISKVFSVYNGFTSAEYTKEAAKKKLPHSGGGPADCIGCGACERICPQRLPIRENLKKISDALK